MDYEIYDKLQVSLGAVKDIYSSQCKKIIDASDADESVKSLVSSLCEHTGNALNELAISISDVLSAAAK